ncbi:ATP-binding cassette domain-containing protein [Acidisoma cellulosilytica]|uniref:ATP-binding cassette domain-containing protein n=1 Tax=Acidisoma cellulosilyticum TaxID=2802395 RepID=A0A963Z1W6_9PROT|nr:ATP-binding cassette domain-containing protein [Acidisoma cellulosilyticum]MCB8881332.1 ATP-binding cassette domain-containing protein [Acidisoma cellulosilyticum]
MSILEVVGVSKLFGALRAVDDVSFTVEAGEIFGIAGPNGSGKSTLFNTISGIPFGPDEGRVVFQGQDLSRLKGHVIARMGLARTFQRETAFDTLSVFENALMGASYGRAARGAGAAEVTEALQFVGFDKAMFRRPAAELSVYDRKCLMLATALAMSPRILLLDEPASGLTKPEIEDSITLIRRIAGRGITILLIEHVLTMLLTLSQRLMVLNQGRMLILGEPEEVVRNPEVIRAYLGDRRRAA